MKLDQQQELRFSRQSSGVAGKVFQACGVALPPCSLMLNLRPVRLRWREACHYTVFKIATY